MHTLSKAGNSLVSVSIAAGVASVMALGVATMISNASKEQKRLIQKFELIELKNSITTAMSNPANCACQLGGKQFQQVGAQYLDIDLVELRAGCGGTGALLAKANDKLPGTQSNVSIEKIQITGISPTGVSGELTGYFTVTPKAASVVGVLQPVRVAQHFKIDSAGNLQSCTFDAYNAKTCPTNQIFVGIDADGAPICRSMPSCPSGKVLTGFNADGSANCIDGTSIANLPPATTTTIVQAGTTPVVTPTVNTVINNTMTKGSVSVAETTMYNSSGNPSCSAGGESKKDQLCNSTCKGQGAASGTYQNGSCDKGRIFCNCIW